MRGKKIILRGKQIHDMRKIYNFVKKNGDERNK